MNLNLKTLSLIVTYKCNAICDGCCFSCSPARNEFLPGPAIEKAIVEGASIETLQSIVFTGGECFLLGPRLDLYVRMAKSYNQNVRCVTNGFWARTLEVANKRMEKLKKAGLDEINISTGDNHLKFIPLESVFNATLASLERGIKTVVTVELLKGSKFDVKFFHKNQRFEKYLNNRQLIVIQNPWINIDKEENVDFGDLTESTNDPFLVRPGKCTTILDNVGVLPDQSVVACCGLFVNKIPDLVLGSLKSSSLKSIIENNLNDLLKIWLKAEGPMAVIEFVRTKISGLDLPKNIIHPCQLCRIIYMNQQVRSILKEHYKEIETRVLSSYFTTLITNRIGAPIVVSD